MGIADQSFLVQDPKPPYTTDTCSKRGFASSAAKAPKLHDLKLHSTSEPS